MYSVLFYPQKVCTPYGSGCYYSGENQPASRSDSITRISRQSLENVSPLTNGIPFHGGASLSRDSGRRRSNFVHVGRWANCDISLSSFLGEGQMVLLLEFD